jgi:acyl-CoA dehydrogenase
VYEFSPTSEQERIVERVRALMDELVYPYESQAVPHSGLPRDLLRRLQARVKAEGLWAAHLPKEAGGLGMGNVTLGLINEQLGRSPIAPRIFGTAAPDTGNAEILWLAGTPEQKRRYLEPLLAGEVRSAFSMTEPDVAGSDPTIMNTVAERDGDEYVINGVKWFTTHGSIAQFLIVMAVTDPQAPPHRRASMLIVDADTPGVTILRDVPSLEHPVEAYGLLGGHSEVRYEDVRVPVDALLGAEGDGFKIAQHRLGPGRIHHCMRWLGVARRAFDMLCERSLYRYAHGSTLAKHETIANWIADSAAEMQAARLMTLHAAWKMDTEGVASARQDLAMIKYYGAGVLHNVVDRALQAHGSLGYSTDLPLEAMYRYARGARFYDGPDEVHRASVARQVLRGYEPPPDEVPTEHIPTRREAARREFADLLEAVTAND